MPVSLEQIEALKRLSGQPSNPEPMQNPVRSVPLNQFIPQTAVQNEQDFSKPVLVNPEQDQRAFQEALNRIRAIRGQSSVK
jgi:hypothetical protein